MAVDPTRASGLETESAILSRPPLAASPMAAPPPLADNAIDKQLLKRSLFPRRATPVKLGRFTVLDVVGRGGMGVVYACFDDRLDRKIAVKLLHGDASRDPEISQRRLLREAQAMARLSHPNIVKVHAVGHEHGRIHVAMEFVRGKSLDAWTELTARPWQDVLAVFVQAGRGLAAAHAAGLVHRDFKPQNVIVGDDGVVKVLDFGLARTAGGDAPDELADEAHHIPPGSVERQLRRSLTRTGQVLGTPLYMSPEQHRGVRATAASDQFSFCISLYQCLYEQMPFNVDSLGALIDDMLRDRVAPPPARTPVPRRIFDALRRGLAADPARRFASMDELLVALARDRASRWRRGLALVAMTAVIGAASFVAAPRTAAPLAQCTDAGAALTGIWDDARRDEIRRVLPGAPTGDLIDRLDRYADAWTNMRRDACLAHADGRQSTHLFDLRTACLEQRRAGLDALAGALATADAAGLDGLLQAAAELPPLGPCADAEALTAAIAPPDDPALRARVQAHREALARAQVREDAGQFQLGRALVDGVLADPDIHPYKPLRAEALLRRGSLEMEAGAHADAEASLADALWTAVAAGHDAVAAQASSKRAFVTAILLGRPADAAASVPLTTALNQRVLRDIDLYAEHLNNIGAVAAAGGDLATTRRRWEEAVALRERHGRADTPKALETLGNLGWLARAEGRYEDMTAWYARTASLSRQLLGPDHASHLRHEWMRCDGLQRIGRAREALARLRDLESQLPRIESPYVRGTIVYTLAVIELEENDLPAARRHLADALAAIPEASEDHDSVYATLIRLAAAERDPAAMRSFYERARRRLPQPLDLHDRRARVLTYDHARALVALGRLEDAVAELAPLHTALAGPEHDLERAEVALLLGDQLRRLGDTARAGDVLTSALSDLQRLLPETSVTVADARLALAEVALDERRFADALELSNPALATYTAIAEPDHPPLARTRFALARALTGDAATVPPAARDHAAQALTLSRSRARDDAARTIAAWLAAHR
jgi:tetratricopeptide (TPR) repeat protein/predicted Ser/Thr protein kinase